MNMQSVDKEKIQVAVKLHSPIEIVSYVLPREKELYIQDVLTEFLKECHQEHLAESLRFCITELLVNAKKANTKRVFFKEKNLDITSLNDYETGMKTFKDETLANLEYYLAKQKEHGLYVKVVLKVDNDFVHIEIRNNSVLTAFEEERISDKINKAKQFNSLEEVFTSVLDATEGAGLGIIIIILMLQKVGLSKDNYKVYTTQDETVTSIMLPVNQQFNSEVTDLLVKFVSMQEKFPVLESNFSNIKNVLASPQININDLVGCFSKDLFLTSYLLNKAAAKQENICSIVQAINVLGIENLKIQFEKDKNLFAIIKDERDDRKLWEHAYRVGFFASCLMQRVNLKNKITEDQMYVLGMLHDIGVVALEVLSIENKILLNQYCDEKKICEYAKELFFNDNKHSVSGSLLAKKWLLPAIISDVIRYHNEPDCCPEEFKDIVYIIHIADMLQYFGQGQIQFSQINKDALKCLDIETEEELRIIYTEIQKLF